MANTFRYTCEQHSGIKGYGWDVYDPRTGGVQTIRDQENGIDLETSFVKFDEGRGGWGARIKGTVRDDAQPGAGSQNGVKEQLKTMLLFTVGLEGEKGVSKVVDSEATDNVGFEGDVTIEGQGEDMGPFRITITEPESNSHPVHNHPSYQSKPLDRTYVHSMMMPQEALWQGKGTS